MKALMMLPILLIVSIVQGVAQLNVGEISMDSVIKYHPMYQVKRKEYARLEKQWDDSLAITKQQLKLKYEKVTEGCPPPILVEVRLKEAKEVWQKASAFQRKVLVEKTAKRHVNEQILEAQLEYDICEFAQMFALDVILDQDQLPDKNIGEDFTLLFLIWKGVWNDQGAILKK